MGAVFFGFEGYGDVARGKAIALLVVGCNERVVCRAAWWQWKGKLKQVQDTKQ